MLLFFADEDVWMALPEGERATAIARIGEWYGQQARAGRIVEGRRLTGLREATTVRLGPAGRSGKPLITDGPFAETKEALGSYAVIEAPDRETALAVAASWPGGGAVEVRPVMEE
ncbi:MAG TPA: YciI family protein [Ktedonobacterales bacterium]|nr:YciI family protein [Ktedonobacterales bacterium]